MYCDFYRLAERPFNVTADPKFLYLNTCYREALASLQYGISQRKGFITLIGEAGTGKTTLLKRLLDESDENMRTVFIFNTNVSFDEILEYIFHEFDLPVNNGRRLYMLQRLNTFLLEELREGRNVALLMDEAQDLDYSVMEDLRLLSNLETAKEKILQIVLAGQPELGQKLGNPSLRQLRQRVAINCRLQPLSRDELAEYIEARLHAAGAADVKLFTRDAEDRIFQISKGIPRTINIVCDNALVIGYALGKKRINGDIVTEAATDLFSSDPSLAEEIGDELPPPASVAARRAAWSMPQIGMVALVVVAVLIGILSVGRVLFGGEAEKMAARPVAQQRSLEVIDPAEHRRAAAPDAARAPREELVRPREVPPPPRPRPVDRESSAAARLPPPPPPAEVRVAGRDEQPVAAPPEPAVREAERVALPEPIEDAPASPPEPVRNARRPQTEPQAAPEEGVPVPAEEAAPPPVEVARVPDFPSDEQLPLLPDEEEVARPAAEEAPRQSTTNELAESEQQWVTARPGDSISEIAIRRYGAASHTILDLLKMANPEIENIDVISAGQRLRLPRLDNGLALLRERDDQYAILLLSTPQQRQANALERALREHDVPAQVQRTSFGGGRLVYRLLVPNLADRREAFEVGRRVRRLLREDEQIAALAR